jgi:hypothetical protein
MDLASDIDEEDEVYDIQPQDSDDKLDSPSSFYGSLSVADSGFKNFEEDALYPYLMPQFISYTKLRVFFLFSIIRFISSSRQIFRAFEPILYGMTKKLFLLR